MWELRHGVHVRRGIHIMIARTTAREAPRRSQEIPHLDGDIDEKPTGAQSIGRAVAILRLVASRSPGGARLAYLYRSAGLTRPTTHRILKGLIAERLIVQEPQTRLYFLGPLTFEFGLAAAQKPRIMDLAQPVLARLAEITADTVYVVVRSGSDAVCLGRREGVFPIKTLTLDVGSRSPLGVGAGGLALLASMEDAEVLDILARNQALNSTYNGVSVASTMRRVAAARRNGYSISRDIVTHGITGIGAVVPSTTGRPTAALSISAISARMTPHRIRTLAPLLCQHCAILGKTEGS